MSGRSFRTLILPCISKKEPWQQDSCEAMVAQTLQAGGSGPGITCKKAIGDDTMSGSRPGPHAASTSTGQRSSSAPPSSLRGQDERSDEIRKGPAVP